MAKAKTKKIHIVLSALTRVEYSEVLEVPANMTAEELDELVDQRYDDVDGGEYYDDPDFWERGQGCGYQNEPADSSTSGTVKRGDGGFEVTIAKPAKTTKKKLYVGRLKERNGEHEYDHQFLFTTSGDPHRYIARVASKFYDEESGQKDGDGYYFDDCCLYVEPKSFTEVDANTYGKLNGFIVEL